MHNTEKANTMEQIEGHNEGKKRVERPSQGRMLGGVLAAFSSYFGIDAVLLRIIVVLLLFFASDYGSLHLFWIYPLCWILIPSGAPSGGTPSESGNGFGCLVVVMILIMLMLIAVSAFCGLFSGLFSQGGFDFENHVPDMMSSRTLVGLIMMFGSPLLLCYWYLNGDFRQDKRSYISLAVVGLLYLAGVALISQWLLFGVCIN